MPVPAKLFKNTLPILGMALLLAGCNTTDRLVDNRPAAVRALASVPPPPEEVTGSIGTSAKEYEPQAGKVATRASEPGPKTLVLPGDEEPDAEKPAGGSKASAADAIAEGREQYRANHFREAEQHFRRATEIEPRNAEAWLGIAASADRLRDFPQADRAYAQARTIKGSTAEVLNNQGYSYLLRGDLKRARETLLAAQKLDPRNKYVENNLALLESSTRRPSALTGTKPAASASR